MPALQSPRLATSSRYPRLIALAAGPDGPRRFSLPAAAVAVVLVEAAAIVRLVLGVVLLVPLLAMAGR
jgi:hypothetical protein